MPISSKYNCIFVHIPKTAGTSIEAALGMHGDLKTIGILPQTNQKKDTSRLFGDYLQHYTAMQIKECVTNYEDYFKFTFVRNPWDRFVSAVMFNGGIKENLKKDISCEDFKKNALRKIENNGIHYKPQLDYILEHRKLPLVDFIGRFENIQTDFEFICNKLNTPIKLENRMKTPHRHYTYYYDDELKNLVAEKYKKDIEYFNYKYGD